MGEICNDNRFEIIAEAKERLLEATNIHTSPKEMEVLDSILYRMWQMGWLPGCRKHADVIPCNSVEPYCYVCSACKTVISPQWKRCPVCEAELRKG